MYSVHASSAAPWTAGDLRALLNKSAREIAWTTGERQHSPFAQFAAHLQIADIERRLTLRKILIGEQAVEVLWW
ncbi:hypothetical protein QZM35_14895 [Burkholderia sp. AU45274]|uniref:hypothetical protein n=1 Tax=Burkholderia sp. AU45274 TaxID=3059205 RepID=UPI002656A655|nr:hypothetical protein [Burkholderia sp. AU45274]MDN7488991.1 hypothetical protein [Burkholderia sp. AU45274]